jgi:hypothetical protein
MENGMNEVIEMPRRERKSEWQRQSRDKFKAEQGYSMTAHYGAGRMRKQVLERDGYACVKCRMTDVEHKAAWGRPITIDHKSKDRSDNSLENLQTLCLVCHGNKDLIPTLRIQRVPIHKDQIIKMRAAGVTYQAIADQLGFSIGAIYKWCKAWKGAKA